MCTRTNSPTADSLQAEAERCSISKGKIHWTIAAAHFLGQAAASLGLLYLSGLTPNILAQAHEHAKTAPRNLDGQPFRFFTPQQAADYEAFASQIFPTDETPGAKEANVVHFVDFALSEIEPQNKQDFAQSTRRPQRTSEEDEPGCKIIRRAHLRRSRSKP